MISNTTTLTKKDFYSLESYRIPSAIPMWIVMFLGGGYILYNFAPYIYYILSDNYIVDSHSAVIAVIFTLIGTAFVLFGIFYLRIISLVTYKRSADSLKRSYRFLDEGIEVIAETEKINQQCIFKYESLCSFREVNDSVLIQLNVSKRPLFLILHDDGYTSGTKEEVLALLESKGICKK